MEFELSIFNKVKVIQGTFLYRRTMDYGIDRPVQAWQWMNQSRAIPDQSDWIRPEVYESWRRCLEEHHLPLGKLTNWNHYPVQCRTVRHDRHSHDIAKLLMQLSSNFETFLKEAGVMLVLTRSDGSLLYALGESIFSSSFMDRLYEPNASWNEKVVGNNGIGSAAQLKAPVAFQGMEHYLSALHPFTTVGYPLLDDNDELVAVIGLVSDHQERISSLFAFLHLICTMVNSHLPLALNQAAQARVLEKIPLKSVKKNTAALDSTLSPELNALLTKAVKLQHYKIPILITGESGVGKDHFVQLLKQAGPRHDQPLIAINCASIPHDLIESELFGYEAGSFTGAKANGKPGKFLLANNGTLFLDEIGDMSLDLQATLLRALETSEITPVGGSKPIKVDVHVVAATNVQLLSAVEAGRFRRDLYYRLNGAQIHLLPLRQRSDKKLIIQQILQRELSKMPIEETVNLSQEVIEFIERHPWPGNIRQLINVLRATLYTAAGELITLEDLPQDFLSEISALEINQDNARQSSTHALPAPAQGSSMSLNDWEMHGIKTTLLECEGNISIAAKKLGITRTTLYKKIERFGLNKQGIAV